MRILKSLDGEGKVLFSRLVVLEGLSRYVLNKYPKDLTPINDEEKEKLTWLNNLMIRQYNHGVMNCSIDKLKRDRNMVAIMSVVFILLAVILGSTTPSILSLVAAVGAFIHALRMDASRTKIMRSSKDELSKFKNEIMNNSEAQKLIFESSEILSDKMMPVISRDFGYINNTESINEFSKELDLIDEVDPKEVAIFTKSFIGQTLENEVDSSNPTM